jgi:predicted Zn-dependent protease
MKPDISRIQAICGDIFRLVGGDHAEVVIQSGTSDLTRFANSTIHQNVEQVMTRVELSVMRDGRVGKALTNQLDTDSIQSLVKRASAACSMATRQNDLLEPAAAAAIQEISAWDEAAAEQGPDQRAEAVRQAAWAAKRYNLKAHGMYESQRETVVYANSAGAFCTHSATGSEFSLTAEGDDVSGWSRTRAWKLADLDIDGSIESAIEDCRRSAHPITVPAGQYKVVLPPDAAADFLYFMAFQVFNGLAFAEGRSPISDKIGRKLFHESITINDDSRHALAPGMPFDFEGLPRQRVTLVENGVIKNVVHDRRSAQLSGGISTGHALPQPNSWGPIPVNLVVDAGDLTLDEMIVQTERGLFVTHFHYTNVVNPMEQLITGMTRDGVFLIEDGKLTSPVRNLRFTESAFRAYSNILGLTKKQKSVSGGFGYDFVVPGMWIDGFTFTSTTEF